MIMETLKITLPAPVRFAGDHLVEVNNLDAHIKSKEHLIEFLCMMQDAFSHLYQEDVSVMPELISNSEEIDDEPVSNSEVIPLQKSA